MSNRSKVRGLLKIPFACLKAGNEASKRKVFLSGIVKNAYNSISWDASRYVTQWGGACSEGEGSN